MPSINAVKDFFTHEDKKIRDNRWIFLSMLVGSILSLLAAFVLTNDAFRLAQNPGAQLSCSVNAVINCGTVAKSHYNELFGFPNSFLGLMMEPVVITVAIAGLVGIKFPRLFMLFAQFGYTLGFIFALWLFGLSYFVIGALCPWCMLVTLSTMFVFFSMTRFNIRENNLYLPKKIQKSLHRFIERDFDKLALGGLIVLMAAAIIIKYGGAIFA